MADLLMDKNRNVPYCSTALGMCKRPSQGAYLLPLQHALRKPRAQRPQVVGAQVERKKGIAGVQLGGAGGQGKGALAELSVQRPAPEAKHARVGGLGMGAEKGGGYVQQRMAAQAAQAGVGVAAGLEQGEQLMARRGPGRTGPEAVFLP